MIRVTLPNRLIGVNFAFPARKIAPAVEHTLNKILEVMTRADTSISDTEAVAIVNQAERELSQPGSTICTIWDLKAGSKEAEKLTSYEESCSPDDNFVKERGRKYSLAGALETMNFTKTERRLIWEAYHERRGCKSNAAKETAA